MVHYNFLPLISFASFFVVFVLLVRAQDQSGFVSIDCGIPEDSSYNDETTDIKYVSDAAFVESGTIHNIDPEFQTKKGTPFLSVLELRLLKSDTYETPYDSLMLFKRWDLGGLGDLPVRFGFRDAITSLHYASKLTNIFENGALMLQIFWTTRLINGTITGNSNLTKIFPYGFVSIDCGIPEDSSYNDETTNIKDLSNNSLTGKVPEFLADLPDLMELNLEGNQLSGPFPVKLLERSNDGSLLLRLEGINMTKKIENPDPCVSASSQNTMKKEEKRGYIIPLVASLAGLLVLLTAVALFWLFKKRYQNGKT
ncbi:hypothetical protein ARALYDRAFT_343268 [Arabidopsis lyrata subsp. lyrata]|uniref:Malectin-like domain-containing protein n=1 Tax=Arabidopsis lyrata subsp. lyrata TaxID=81972 RepID=D7L7K7_ARALL|nr:hypothetical protein ARALYDRAFT_343268 [Arabidopsis lyrata subsp. lyrata]